MSAISVLGIGAFVFSWTGALALGVGWVLSLVVLGIYRVYFHPLSKFPGPKLAAATNWYECYYDLMNGSEYTFMHETERMHEVYGPIVRINPQEIHVKDPTWYDALYAGPGQIRDKYGPAASTVGAPLGIFGTLPHHVHRRRRGAINGFLSKRALVNNEHVLRERCEALTTAIKRFAGKSDSHVVEFRVLFLAFATDVIFTLSYDGSLDLLNDPEGAQGWRDTIGAISGLTPLIKQFPWLIPVAREMPLWFWNAVLPDLARSLVLHRDTEARAAEVLALQTDANRKDPYANAVATEGGRSPTIYHEVLKSDLPAEEKTLRRLAQEAFTLVVAGGETTSRTLVVALYYILANPSVQERLMTELKQIMPDPSVIPECKRFEQLPYLTAVIKESLRLGENITTRLPLISPEKPLIYQGWEIPPGTPVSLTHGKTLLDPTVYSDPMSFKPERWLASADNPELDRMSRLFVPFGRGNRSCYGQNLAWMELYMAIGVVFRRFELELFEVVKERDVDNVRDCFTGDTSHDSKGLRARLVRMRS